MGNNRLLIIDDDLDLLVSLKARLEKKNFIVFTASSKSEGLRLLLMDKPDLLILDIMMETDLEGYNMLSEIRNEEKFSSLPIILYSAMLEVVNVNLQAAVEDVETYPNVAFVDKTDELEELIFRINCFLTKSEIDA